MLVPVPAQIGYAALAGLILGELGLGAITLTVAWWSHRRTMRAAA